MIVAALAFLAFVALYIVPSLLTALNRSRSSRTMADMRAIATAWEARAEATNSYVIGTRLNSAELARVLEPKYIRKLPRTDGWGSEFVLTADADTYSIRSFGSDGKPDRDAAPKGPMTHFGDDVVYANGSFVQYPEGAG